MRPAAVSDSIMTRKAPVRRRNARRHARRARGDRPRDPPAQPAVLPAACAGPGTIVPPIVRTPATRPQNPDRPVRFPRYCERLSLQGRPDTGSGSLLTFHPPCEGGWL